MCTQQSQFDVAVSQCQMPRPIPNQLNHELHILPMHYDQKQHIHASSHDLHHIQQNLNASSNTITSHNIGHNSNNNNANTRHLTPHNKGKPKRVRTIFTPYQLERLEQEFAVQMYLVGIDRLKLAKSLGLSEAQVKVWFQNRRIKFRKLNPSPFLSLKPFEDNNSTINNGNMNHNTITTMSNNSASSLSSSDNYSSI